VHGTYRLPARSACIDACQPGGSKPRARPGAGHPAIFHASGGADRVRLPQLSRSHRMSLESVRTFLAEKAPDIAILETEARTATAAGAASAHGVEPAQIAKTLSLRVGERVVLVVARGDARLDNKKAKARFGAKPRMLEAAEVEALTGHPVGGVCPFGLAQP